MTPTTTDDRLNEVFREMVEHEPALAALFAREPSYRYFHHGQWRYCWTTETVANGKYRAFVYRPLGPGARTGKAKQLKLQKQVTCRTRRQAKAKALAWFNGAAP